MNRASWTILIVVVPALALGSLFLVRSGRNQSLPAEATPSARSRSLISLIANPERHDGERVVVKGVASFEFENNSLYTSEEAFRYLSSANAVWLDVRASPVGNPPIEELAGRHVLVEGTFLEEPKGHFGRYAGTITGITRLEAVTDRETLKTRLDAHRKRYGIDDARERESAPPATSRELEK